MNLIPRITGVTRPAAGVSEPPGMFTAAGSDPFGVFVDIPARPRTRPREMS